MGALERVSVVYNSLPGVWLIEHRNLMSRWRKHKTLGRNGGSESKHFFSNKGTRGL